MSWAEAAAGHRIDPSAAFLILRAVTINGLQLRQGDRLPADAAVRQNAARLSGLCQARYMQPIMVQESSTAPQVEEAHAEVRRGSPQRR